MIPIMLREFQTYFKTPLGYVFMGLFLLISGYFFTFGNLLNSSSYYSTFLGDILFIYLFAVPLLTMRLLSEDRKQQTDQLLLTSPITITDIVLGKFLAALLVFLLTLLMTVPYAVVVYVFGDLAVSQTFGAYIGFILLGASFIALGILISAISQNQINAAFFTFFVLLVIWFLNSIRTIAPIDLTSSTLFAIGIGLGVSLYVYGNTKSYLFSFVSMLVSGILIMLTYFLFPQMYIGLIPRVLGWFSLLDRFNGFSLGLLKVADLVFYLSFVTVFLFMSIRFIEKRRWV